jgi:hypothetical protein
LSNEIQKDPSQESHEKDQSSVDKDTESEDFEKIALKIQPLKGLKHPDVVDDEIERIAYKPCRSNLKNIGDDDEECSKNKMPLVFKQIRIEIPEFFHALVVRFSASAKRTAGKKLNCCRRVSINKIWSASDKTKYPLFGSCKRLKQRIFAGLNKYSF